MILCAGGPHAYLGYFQNPFTRVTACHVATYYYVGFCYIMLRRYPDAIRVFVQILNFILRMRQYHTRSYQYDQVRCSPISVEVVL
jgi:hypothetical protein